MKSEYEHMRLIVMFDLPTESKELIKKYTKFRKFLLDDGFIMMQYSVYTRYCHNMCDCEKHINRVKKNNPKIGNVRIIKITEKQYENILILYGEISESEMINNRDGLIVIE